MPTPLTPEIIATHERLYPRLAALLKQVERVAGKRPGDPAPEKTIKLAGQLCVQAAKLLGREGRGISPPPPGKPLDHAGLAVLLGQAVAGLEAFEAAHAMLSAKHRTLCWVLPDGTRRPVARHVPATPPKGATAWAQAEKPVDEHWRKKFIARLVERENKTYLLGYRDCQEGKPPRQPLDEPDFI